MKHFYFIIILLAGVFMVGCQDQLALKDDAKPTELVTKAGADEYTAQTSERYVFPAEKDFKAWGDLPTLEDRFAACEVPENLLRAMTTDALVRTALNYPLNFIYSAYNDPFVAVGLIFKNSALYRELAAREDAADVLLQYFDQTTVDKGNKDSVFNRSETLLTYSNEMFLDYLMASGKIPGLNDGENGKRLQEIARRKLAERRADSETFSGISKTPLMLLADESSRLSEATGGSRYVYYTPFGQTVALEYRDELTETENFWITFQYTEDYPNASVHGMASNIYNGNGYAWVKQDPTNPSAMFTETHAWLEKGYTPGGQMRRFWEEDLYVETNLSDIDKEKIYYGDTPDHSAIYYGDYPEVYFLSKWGTGPLMEHAPAYCPYSASALRYFKIRISVLVKDGFISGPDHVPVDSVRSYTFPSLRGLDSWDWSVESVDPQQSTAFSYQLLNDNWCKFSCLWSGTYVMTVEGTYNNNTVLRTQKTITSP